VGVSKSLLSMSPRESDSSMPEHRPEVERSVKHDNSVPFFFFFSNIH